MNREEFLSELRSAIEDGIKRNYRNLVYIEKKNYLDDVISILDLYYSINQNAITAYAFHPWATGAKDRLEIVAKHVKGYLEDIDYSSADRYLGKTYDIVILDLVDNFEPNSVGRLVDLAKGGGLIILYTDNLTSNKLLKNSIMKNGKVRDIYEIRFVKKLHEHKAIFIANEDGYFSNKFDEILESFDINYKSKLKSFEKLHDICKSFDQHKVLDKFLILNRGGKRVMVITAGRGRGKSAITGLGLAELIYLFKKNNRNFKAVVSSPSIANILQVMEFLKKGLEVLGLNDFRIIYDKQGYIKKIFSNDFKVYYSPPENAINEEGNLLVIDEAAAVGITYIDKALRRWKKVVLVTTIYGYEGSGRSFLKYLRELLQHRKTNVIWIEMEDPIRYTKGDPIEKWLYDTLVLDAEAELPSKEISKVTFESVDINELFKDDRSLRQLYGILVAAHYRNNPNDLMILGDAVHHKLYALKDLSTNTYFAVAQISEEGGFDENMINMALKGGTFDGDLIPDRLIKHSRIIEFGKLKGWRIVRIAVIPELQNKGYGSQLLQEIITQAEKSGIDWIGASFMADPNVLNFWLKNGFTVIHISPRKSEKYGDFPVIVARPLNENAKKVINLASYLLKDKLLLTIHDTYFNLEPDLARLILDSIKVHRKVYVNNVYLDKIAAFLQGISPYESTSDAIHMLALKYFWDAERDWSLSSLEEDALIAKTLQGKPWSNASSILGINTAELNELIYQAVQKLAKKYYGISAESINGVTAEKLSEELLSDESQHAEW
ncbi:MAG: tRNA(Met) cytidine acetyltransferase [Sulfolobus sp.]|nr:tRNA(Met) cytidine acetyltransferase [Sulfolobus sp.]